MAAGRGEREAGERARAGLTELTELTGLTQRQRGLVAALVAGAEPPPGLDRERVRVQAAVLLRKRGRGVAHAQPDLAAALGPEFGAAFGDYASGRTGPPPDRAADDALEFARYLRGAGGSPHRSAEVRRQARRVTRSHLFRRAFRFRN